MISYRTIVSYEKMKRHEILILIYALNCVIGAQLAVQQPTARTYSKFSAYYAIQDICNDIGGIFKEIGKKEIRLPNADV